MDAMDQELQSMIKNQVFFLVKPPLGRKIVGSKVISKVIGGCWRPWHRAQSAGAASLVSLRRRHCANTRRHSITRFY